MFIFHNYILQENQNDVNLTCKAISFILTILILKMPKFSDTFERNQATMDFFDLGYRLMEGVGKKPTPLIHALQSQTDREVKNILLAGSPSSFNPEFVARLYRRLVNLTLNKGVNQDTSRMLSSARDADVKVYTVDRDAETLQACRDSMIERGVFLKEHAGIELAYQQMDLTDASDDSIPPNSIDVAFMDCILPWNPEKWIEILANLAKMIGDTGLIFFREMLVESPLFFRNSGPSTGLIRQGVGADYHFLYECSFKNGASDQGLSVKFLPISKPYVDREAAMLGSALRERVGVITKQANVTMG